MFIQGTVYIIIFPNFEKYPNLTYCDMTTILIVIIIILFLCAVGFTVYFYYDSNKNLPKGWRKMKFDDDDFPFTS